MSSGALRHLICGIGINANQTACDFPEELSGIAGSVSMATGKDVSRSVLAASVINAVFNMYDGWLAGDTSYISRYREDCITLGREVRLISGQEERTAFAKDIDDGFGLIVEYPDGSCETVRFGDVSVRGLLGYN